MYNVLVLKFAYWSTEGVFRCIYIGILHIVCCVFLLCNEGDEMRDICFTLCNEIILHMIHSMYE